MSIVPRLLFGLLVACVLIAAPCRAELVASFEADSLAIYDDASGLWRRSELAPLFRGDPDWQVLLDVAALGRAEGHDWHLKSADCLPPDYRRCLLLLGVPGSEDVALREYDTRAHDFVQGGFSLPPGPTRAVWYDDARIMVVADGGPGTVTDAGVPRRLRLWTRGEPLFNARTIFAGDADVAGILPIFSLSGGGLFHAALVQGADGTRTLYQFGWAENFRSPPLPGSFEFLDFFQGSAIILLHESWQRGNERFPAGSLIAYPVAALLGPGAQTVAAQAYTPPAGYGVIAAKAGRDQLFIALRGAAGDRLVSVRKGAPDWPVRDIDVPGSGVMSLIAASNLADAALIERQRREGSEYYIVGRGRPRQLAP